MKRLSIVTVILFAAIMSFGGITVSAQQANQKGSIWIKTDETGFAELAKISMDSAISAALKEVPGRVLTADLENEDGYLVYGIEIIKTDNQVVDVKVDAGNGKVLKIDQDQTDKEGHEREGSDRGHEERER
jgi:uncharacterized membrane protein YkoI